MSVRGTHRVRSNKVKGTKDKKSKEIRNTSTSHTACINHVEEIEQDINNGTG